MTVRGARGSSTATGYVKRARARPNLRLLTGAPVERIVIEGGRAASVRFRRGGRACKAVARREVLLAGGAIASPHLIMLSGIGPAADLAAMGIPHVSPPRFEERRVGSEYFCLGTSLWTPKKQKNTT